MSDYNCGYIFRGFLAAIVLLFTTTLYAAPHRILCWIVDSTVNNRIVSGDNLTRWPQLFSTMTDEQHHFIFPLMDLDDAAVVTPEMVRNQFLSPIRRQSIRYDADLLLIAQVSMNGQQWSMNWQLADALTQEPLLIKGHAEGMQKEIVMQIRSALAEFEQNNGVILTENDALVPPLGISLSSDVLNHAPVQEDIPLY